MPKHCSCSQQEIASLRELGVTIRSTRPMPCTFRAECPERHNMTCTPVELATKLVEAFGATRGNRGGVRRGRDLVDHSDHSPKSCAISILGATSFTATCSASSAFSTTATR